jgi:glucose/arabinose dehydrogenase
VSAYDGARTESVLSSEVSAVVGTTPSDYESLSRCAANVGDCARVRFRASDLGAVSDIAAVGDGRLLVVEKGRHVRVITASGLLQEPAISSPRDDTELASLAVDPAFDRTGYVFLGMTQPLRDGGREFRVVRYRAVQNTLGEGAAVLTGLSFHGDHKPRFALDAAGKIYVAMPAAHDGSSDPYAGRILRFNIDGSVPAENARGSPVVGEGYAIPHALASNGDDLWIAGIDRRGEHSTTGLSFDAPSGSTWLRTLTTFAMTPLASFEVVALDARRLGTDAEASSSIVFVDADRGLHRMTMRGREVVTPVEAIRWSRDEKPLDVAVDPSGSIFVVVETNTGSFAVVQVTGATAPR